MSMVRIITLTVMAAAAGRVVGAAIPSIGSGVGSVVAAWVAMFSGIASTVRPNGPGQVTWRRIEFILTIVIAVIVMGAFGRRAGGASLAVAVLLAFTTRLLTESTIGDLALMDRLVDDRPHGTPQDRIRLRVLGVGLGLTAAAGYTLALEAGLSDLRRPAVGTPIVAVLVWFGVGILAVGVVSLGARRRLWDRNDVTVESGLPERWLAGVVTIASLVVVSALVVPGLTSQLSAIPANAIAETPNLSRIVENVFDFLDRNGQTNQEAGSETDEVRDAPPIESEPRQRSDPPSWVGDVMLAAIIATVFVWAVRAGRRARFERGRNPAGGGGWRSFLALIAGFAAELGLVWRGFLLWLSGTGRSQRGGSPPHSASPAESSLRGWTPGDSQERRVARAFTRMAGLVDRRPGETPTDVADQVGTRTDSAAARVVLRGYLDARYSPEPILPRTADAVESAAERISLHEARPPLPDGTHSEDS